jgi:Tol biopolymer transport system component
VIHGRLIARAARAAAFVALASSAVLPTAAQAATVMVAPAGYEARPDGAPRLNGRIAYASDDALIRTLESDGTRLKTAFDRIAGAPWSTLTLRDPAYSADGRKLAFTAESNDASRIGVIDADRHQDLPVTVAESGAALKGLQHPSWSPDGKKIAFRAFGADWGLYTVSASGGTPVKVALTAKEPAEPVYSPDGRLLAFSALDANNDRRVYLKNLETEQVTQLTSGGSEQAFPAFSPDGTTVAYVNTPLAPGGGAGRPQIAVRPVGGGAQDILWSDDTRSALGRPAFSPDGKRVAFTATKPGCEAEVTIVDTDGAPNPRGIACGDPGAVDWAVRTAQGVIKLASALPGSDRESGDGDTDTAIVAAGGRYEIFTSSADNLGGGPDENQKGDVFIRDLVRGGSDLVSVATTGKAAAGASDMPVASKDANWIAFRSTARDIRAGFTGGETAVYLRDRANGETRLVSRLQNSDKTGPSGDNRPVAISEEGRYILFASTSDDVIGDAQGENAGDTDVDLFRFDSWTSKTELVTLKAGTLFQAAHGETGRAFLSADGNTVVFESTAPDLVNGFVDNNGAAPSIFKRDLTTSTTTLVDGKLGSATESSEAAGQLQGLSADGRTVLFQTAAKDILENFVDGNGDAPDVYVRTATGSSLVTTSGVAADHGANGTPGAATLSANGARVFFSSTATDLNGQYTVTGEQAWMRTLTTPTAPAVLLTRGTDLDKGANGASTVVDASATGAFVVIASAATDLTAPLTHHDTRTLYRVDTATFEAEPVSARGDDANDAAPTAQRGAISADGNTIAWTTRATNLIDSFLDGNGADAGDAFAWIERTTAAQDPLKPTVEINTPQDEKLYRQDTVVLADYECADEGPSGLASCEGTVPAGTPLDFSDTGSFDFTVTATDNAGNVTTKTVQYRVASANKKLSLASRSTRDRLTTGDDESRAPVFSADGRYLVFTSRASNLVPGFIDASGGRANVYRRDLNTGITELVSAGLPRPGDDGRPRGANAEALTENNPRAISPDGRYVLLETDATNLVEGMTAPFGTQLYVRDMQTGT